MSEDILSEPMALGVLGGGPSKYNLRMAAVALADKRYNVPPETRQKLVEVAGKLLESDDPRTALAAAKVILAADSVDVKRDETDLQERGQEFLESTHAIREAMKRADVRYALAKTAEVVCGPTDSSGDPAGASPAH